MYGQGVLIGWLLGCIDRMCWWGVLIGCIDRAYLYIICCVTRICVWTEYIIKCAGRMCYKGVLLEYTLCMDRVHGKVCQEDILIGSVNMLCY